MNLLLKVSKTLLSAGVRGGTRFTNTAARYFTAFQNVTVDVKGGQLSVDLRNAGVHGLFARPMQYCPEHQVMQRVVRPGDTAYDIGANAGLFSVWLSHLTGTEGRVYSFEPNPAYRKSLDATVGGLSNAKFYPIALSNSEGEVDLYVPADDTMASLRDWTHGENGQVTRSKCRIATIDGLIKKGELEAADFIKCDIEGGELNCFRGATKLLDRSDAPMILFEANINSTSGYDLPISAAFDFLRELRLPEYSFFHVGDDGNSEAISSIDFAHGNILACPRSRLERMSDRR